MAINNTAEGTYNVREGDGSDNLTVSSFSIGEVTDSAGKAMTSNTVPDTNIATGSEIVVNDDNCP